MPRRLGEMSRMFCYRWLVERDGERCARCFEIPVTRNDGFETQKLEIDHVDGDEHNWSKNNLRLLCKTCNIFLRNKVRPVLSEYSARNERERKEGQASTRIIRQAVAYSHLDAPVTMQANYLFEIDARNWCLAQISDKGFYLKQSAITGMAELVGCSPLTATRYLSKLTSPLGPLQEVKDMLGTVMLTWKDDIKPDPTVKIDLDKGEKVGQHDTAEHLF